MLYYKILMKLHLSGPLKIIGLKDNVSVLNITEASLGNQETNTRWKSAVWMNSNT